MTTPTIRRRLVGAFGEVAVTLLCAGLTVASVLLAQAIAGSIGLLLWIVIVLGLCGLKGWRQAGEPNHPHRQQKENPHGDARRD